jgi:hypothetical protein
VVNLFIAYGYDRDAARRSLTRAGRRAARLDREATAAGHASPRA